MTTHWKCCCGCQPGGGYKVGIISKREQLGYSDTGSGSSGGFNTIFQEAIDNDTVSEIITASSENLSSDTEKQDAVLDLIRQSCVLVMGATDWGQPDLSNPSDNDWARSPAQKPQSLFFCPDADLALGDDVFEDKFYAEVGKKVVKEGGLVILLGGAPRNFKSEFSDAGGCLEDSWAQTFICSSASQSEQNRCGGSSEGHVDHVGRMNGFLNKLREYPGYEEPEGHDQMVIETSNIQEHSDQTGCDRHKDLKIHEFIECTEPDGDDCEQVDCGDYNDCEFCGQYGPIGREPHYHYNYNLFTVGMATEFTDNKATWLNDPEDEENYISLYLQEQNSGKVTGGVWIHDRENIDYLEVEESGFAIERFGKGHVVYWGCATTFLGRVDGTTHGRNNNFTGNNCGWPGLSNCGSLTVEPDKYGIKHYEDNAILLDRIIDRVVGKDVEELK